MPANKTAPTTIAAADHIAGIAPDERRDDAQTLVAMMARISGEGAAMWGPSIIGFGTHHYVYESGRKGDMPRIAFAARKAELVLYVGASTPNIAELLAHLGKHKTGKGCLYVKSLADVDMSVLKTIIARAFANHPA
ncbi:MAG: DUF1801 domain-containing protein [Sphingomonas sp.]